MGGGASKAAKSPTGDSAPHADASSSGNLPSPHEARGGSHATTPTAGHGWTADGAPPPSWTLHEAGLRGSAAAVTVLLAAGADVHAMDIDG